MTEFPPDTEHWPHTITVGEDWYGLRIETDHGSAVEYVDARSLGRNPMGQEPEEGTRSFSGSSAAERRPVSPMRAGSTPAPRAMRPALGSPEEQR